MTDYISQQAARWLDDPDALLSNATDNALGYVGFDLPEDVLAATGRPCFHLPWRVNEPTPNADKWMESSFTPAAKSILEDWMTGKFDHLKQIVFSRGEDSVQRLWYYVSELQRCGKIGGPKPIIYDVARVPRDTSVSYTENSIRRLMSELDLSAADLEAGISLANQRRELLSKIGRAGITASAAFRTARATLLPSFETQLAEDIPTADELPNAILVGSNPPDERLASAIEAASWRIGKSLNDLSLNRLGNEITNLSDPVKAVASQSQHQSISSRQFTRPNEILPGLVAQTGARAVIMWVIEEDEARAWHVPGVRKAMAEAGVPALVMTRRAWDGSDGASDEINNFLEALS